MEGYPLSRSRFRYVEVVSFIPCLVYYCHFESGLYVCMQVLVDRGSQVYGIVNDLFTACVAIVTLEVEYCLLHK